MIKVKNGYLYHYTEYGGGFEGEIQVGKYRLTINGDWLHEKGGHVDLTLVTKKEDYVGEGTLFTHYPSRLGMITVRLYEKDIDIYLRLDLVKQVSSKERVETFYKLIPIQE